MKKKIIAIFAIFILSFNIMVSARQEKTEASALLLSYVIFKAGVSFTAFTGFASLMAVNGYHMQLSDLAVSFANNYYDYANGVYVAKGDQINFLEKLSLATASFISGNDPISLSDLESLKEGILEYSPQKIDMNDFVYDFEVVGFELGVRNWLEADNGFAYFRDDYKDKIVKFTRSTDLSDYHFYVDFNNYGWHNNYIPSTYYPTVKVIAPNGITELVEMVQPSSTFKLYYDTTLQTMYLNQSYGSTVYNSTKTYKRNNYIPVGDEIDYTTAPDSFASSTDTFKKAYPNYYTALSGKATSTDELIGLMNTDEYLQREVAKLLENQKVNEENALQVPTVVDGVITYPTADIPDVPDVPYSPTETWYNNLLGWVSNIPDLLIGGITDLFNETLIPALDSLKDIVLQIPDLLTNIWQWILDFPDLLYLWFVPSAPMIAETWQPVIDLWDFKLDPIVAPFKTLTFYETEYQDISVPLKFGSYEKEHKIIDFQYIKSQRDSIKSLIRAFLWILIIFFNLDQIHRLIRNQSLLNTYVRKIDKGA